MKNLILFICAFTCFVFASCSSEASSSNDAKIDAKLVKEVEKLDSLSNDLDIKTKSIEDAQKALDAALEDL